ncbi:MAG: EamA family transporter [Candidatus Paceibacterota bacterium]|jgi:drug/metabolite transporter (DMT)-like permease
MGIAFAFLALVAWGVGDFLIQKSTRRFGNWQSLFFITALGTIVLFPFIAKDLPAVWANSKELILLTVTSFIIFLAALFDFQALRVGKLSVVEPIFALEVPIAALLASFILREHLTFYQISLIVLVILGIFLVSNRSLDFFKKFRWERGVQFALLATVGMGLTNFFIGVSSRATDPLMINWFLSLFIFVACLIFLTISGQWRKMFGYWQTEKRLILSVGIIDNTAWIAYAYSVLYLPIAIAVSISESYIALAALLGIFLNREKLKKHQYLGLVITVIAVIVLARITEM